MYYITLLLLLNPSFTYRFPSFLSSPGFIAGVTNPRFEEMEKWWDVLCNVATGTVKLASHIPATSAPDAHVAMDNEFIQRVLLSISSHHSEDQIRLQFREYAQGIVDLANDEAEFADEVARKKFTLANQRRAEQWKNSGNESYVNYVKDAADQKDAAAIKGVDVKRVLKRLFVAQNMPEKEVISLFEDITKSVTSDEQVIELLSYLTPQHGGLYPIAQSLYHPSDAVQRMTYALLRRIEGLKQGGERFIGGMNRFLRIAYERQKARLEK